MKLDKHYMTTKIKIGLGICVAIGLAAPMARSGAFTDAVYLLYDGTDPEFTSVYAIGEPYLPPSVRIQPLKASKDAIVSAVDIVSNSGLDDQIGAVAFSSVLEWSEPLSTNYARVRAKLRGTPLGIGGSLAVGLQAARVELLSTRSRLGAKKVIVLVTDGSSPPADVLMQAQQAKNAGMIVHVIGIGAGADTALLDQIAAIGGGISLQIDTATPSWVYAADLQAALGNVTTNQVGVNLIR